MSAIESQTTPDAAETRDESLAHVIQALLRFFHALRYRQHVLFVSLAAAALLGGLYYATATRMYSASASLLVMYSGFENTTPALGGEGLLRQNTTPTFESLVTAPKVIEGALPYLQPEYCVDLAGASQENWAGIIQRGLKARTVKNTSIIAITYCSRAPESAVNILGAVVQAYMEFLDKTNKGSAAELIRVLTKEKADLVVKLAQKERELLEVGAQVGDLGIRAEDGKIVPPSVQQVLAFNDSLIQTQRRRIELEATLAAVQAAMRSGQDLRQYFTGLGEGIGKELLFRGLGLDAQDTATLTTLERGVVDDRAALEGLKAHLGPAHPEVRAKMEKIRLGEQYLRDYQERARHRLAEAESVQLGPLLVQTLQQKLGEARELEGALGVRFAQARDEAVQHNGQFARLEIIRHDLQWLRGLHDALSSRIANMDLKHEGAEVRTSLLEEPKANDNPVSPNLRVVLLMVVAGGVGAGLLLVGVLDVLDDRFRSLDELQRQVGASVLTIVRRLDESEAGGLEAVHVHASPDSAQSEAFRTLRTALALAESETRRLVISSAEPGDGKTTILANLAACCAQAGKRTLLIDADLRRPGLTTMLGLRSMEGLSRLLRGEGEIARAAAECIRHTPLAGLDVLPSGARMPNPTELLSGARLAELLAWAETVYDQILVDCPPTLVTSDVAILGHLVDGALLVVQPEKNRRRQVLRAVEMLAALKVPLLGVIVNRVVANSDRGYYGYSSGYGYGYGYYSYGHGSGYGYGGYGHDEPTGAAVRPAQGDEQAAAEEGGALHVPPAGYTPAGVAARSVPGGLDDEGLELDAGDSVLPAEQRARGSRPAAGAIVPRRAA
jgi:capsular exopolysaccharide synthesis family protein